MRWRALDVKWMTGPLGWGQGSAVITQRWCCETIFLFLSAPDWAKKETQCHSFLTAIHLLCIDRDVFTKKCCWGSVFKVYVVSNTQTHQLTGFHLNRCVHMHTNILLIVGFMEFSDYSSGHVNSIIRYPFFQKGRLFDYEKWWTQLDILPDILCIHHMSTAIAFVKI